MPNAVSPLEEINAIAQELDLLLQRYKLVLKEEEIDRQVENLKRLLEHNRTDFASDTHISETGSAWLGDLCMHLKQVVEERQRLEGEGGLPETPEQVEQNEALLAAIRRIESIMAKAEHVAL